MAATIAKGKTFGATEQVTAAKLHQLVDSATISGIIHSELAAWSDSATTDTLDITKSGNGIVFDINKTGTGAGDVIDLDNAGTGAGVQVNSTSSGIGVEVISTGTGISHQITHASGDTGDAIQIDYAANGICLDLNKTAGTGNVIDIVNGGTGTSLNITQTGDNEAIFIDNDAATQEAIEIDQDSNSASNIWALKITCDNAGAGSAAGIHMGNFAAGEFIFMVPQDDTSIDTTTVASTGRVAIKDASDNTRYLAYWA